MKSWLKWLLIVAFMATLVLIDYLFNISNYITISLALIFLVGFPIYRIIKHRDFFLTLLREMEGQVFGKPLEKKFWKKGELKNVKVKMKWRKKKDE